MVTANKALLAIHGTEIFAAARDKGVVVAFEAAVAGGIPIIKALREGLTANRIEWIAGIINGTTNFILSEMRDRAASTSRQALAEAQRLGYAEADPTFDIEGIDAAHKATHGQRDRVRRAGAVRRRLRRRHHANCRRPTSPTLEHLGYRIKLLAITKRRDAIARRLGRKASSCACTRRWCRRKRLIANVEGAMNAVLVHGDAVGTTLYYGKGAGAEPTASAVIADLVDLARLATADPDHRVPHLAFQPAAMQDLSVLSIDAKS